MRTTVILLLSCSCSFAGDYADSLPRAATDSLQRVQLNLLLKRSDEVDNQIREMNGTVKTIFAGAPSCDHVSTLRESCRNLFLEKIALDQDLMGQKWIMRKIDHSVAIGDARKQEEKDNARGQHFADSLHAIRKNQEKLFAAFYLRSVVDRYVQKRDGLFARNDSTVQTVKDLIALSEEAKNECLHVGELTNQKAGYTLKKWCGIPVGDFNADSLRYFTNLLQTDTDLIQMRILKALNDFAQKYAKPLAAYAQASDTSEKLQWQISASIKKCGAVSISGQVTSIDKASVSLWGVTALYGCDHTQYGCDQPNHWDEDGIPGILHEESNIVLSPYSTDLKTDGKAIVGEELAITGYCYSNTGLGTNASTTKEPVYRFAPCVCLKSLRELEQKLEIYRSRANEILNDIGISVSDLALVTSLAQPTTNTQEGLSTKDPH